jgi:hypothetical protein
MINMISVRTTKELIYRHEKYVIGDIVDVNNYDRAKIIDIGNNYIDLDCSTRNNSKIITIMLSDIHKLKHFEVFQDPAKYFLPRI